jgi:hypothetical protein
MDLKLQRYVRTNLVLALAVYSLLILTVVLIIIQGVGLLLSFELQLFGVTPLAIGGASTALAFVTGILGYLNALKAERDGYPDLGATNS